ncbi:MAG: phosphoglycerate dehydrogenase [Ruthenibacterium sp.]
MYNIKTLNSISPKGLVRLSEKEFAIDKSDAPDGILVRSASLHDMPLPKSLLAIARAGAGTNNIPIDTCSDAGIVVFNTPGANANAVKELVLGGLVLASRDVVSAAEWAKTLKGKGADVPKLVEKGKGQFAGPELLGKKLGVVGLGAIGVKVANMATHLGMEVYGYDPYLSIDAAWNLSRNVHHCTQLAELLAQCDYVTVHVPATSETKGFLNAETLAQMPHGVRILNFARAELVDAAAMANALASGQVGAYVVDFPTDEMLCVKGCLCIPHLGASTPESEDNCAVMAAKELSEYLLNGTIACSVNYPAVSMPRSGKSRICVAHKNVPGILASITDAASKAHVNIENMLNKSKKDYAYTLLDTSDAVPQSVAQQLQALPDILRVRIID